MAVDLDSAGNLLVAGGIGQITYLNVFDSSGNRTLEYTDDTALVDAVFDNTGSIRVLYQANDPAAGSSHPAVATISVDGSTRTVVEYATPEYVIPVQLLVDPGGNTVISGRSSSAAVYVDWFVMEGDTQGNILWSDVYNATTINDEFVSNWEQGIALDEFGNVLVTGSAGPDFSIGRNRVLSSVALKYDGVDGTRKYEHVDQSRMGFGLTLASSGDSFFVMTETRNRITKIVDITDSNDNTAPQAGADQLAAVLTGATAGFGEAWYRDDNGDRRFELRVYNATPGAYDVIVSGRVVAQIIVNAKRVGKLEMRDGTGGGNRLSFPPNWPAVSVGTAVQIGNLYSGSLAVEGEDSRIEENATVRLVGANGEYLGSEYEAEQEDGNVTVRRFELHVRNLTPSQQFAFQINGQMVQTITTDALGNANLQYSDRTRPGFTAFPAGFPAITDGTQIAIGTVFSGAYATAPITQAPITDGGDHLHLSLFGTGTMQGQAIYEAVPGVGGAVRREFKVELWNGTPGVSIPVNVGDQLVGSILINGKGYGKLVFEDGSVEKPFPANWPGASVDTILTVGSALTGAFTGVGQTLSPLEDNAREAYELDQTLGLQALSTMYENWGGRGEKWLRGKGSSWYFITPEGTLYRWDGKAGANGQKVAVLDDSLHANPELLHEAEAPEVTGADDRLVRAEATKLDRELNLTSAAPTTTNWGGLAEKWFRGTGQKWYFMTPDGTLTR